jgi:hypothetical protein
MFKKYYDKKILLATISAAVLANSFIVGSQFVQPSEAQDLSQLGQQAKERIGQLTGDNQTGNQTDNQSGGVLGQLGERAGSFLPGQ